MKPHKNHTKAFLLSDSPKVYFCDLNNHIQVGCDLLAQIKRFVHNLETQYTVRLHKAPSYAVCLPSPALTSPAFPRRCRGERSELKGHGVMSGDGHTKTPNKMATNPELAGFCYNMHHWRHFFFKTTVLQVQDRSNQALRVWRTLKLAFLMYFFFLFLFPPHKASGWT